jgi:hypothetical protein
LKFRGGFHVRHTKFIAAAALLALLIATIGCGTSDYVQSVQITSTGANAGGFFNLAGADGTLQLVVNAVYHSGKTVPVTNSVTFAVTTIGVDANAHQPLPAYGPTTVPIDTTGLMTAVEALCTWDNTANPPTGTPVWVYTGYYQITATYKGMVSQPIAIGVGSETSNSSEVGGCGPGTATSSS